MGKRRYEVVLSTGARRALERLWRSDRRLFERVDNALDHLAAEPREGKPLVGPLKGRWSYRVGPVRIVYRISEERLRVLVLRIGQRRDVYRR